MSRLVARDGGPEGYDYCQLVKTPDGQLIFPDEQGAAIIAQALLAGKIFHRILDHDIPRYSTQKRRVKVIVGIDEGTGTNYFAAYSVSKHPEPPLNLSLRDEANINPYLSSEHIGSRTLSTVRKHGASLADFSPHPPWENQSEAALTHHARILIDLITYGDELLAAIIPKSEALKDPETQTKVTTFTAHQLNKLSGGIGSEVMADEYALVNSLVQSLNLLAIQLFAIPTTNIPW
jgi:hypothetical protein